MGGKRNPLLREEGDYILLTGWGTPSRHNLGRILKPGDRREIHIRFDDALNAAELLHFVV
jgi:hypothetical protein